MSYQSNKLYLVGSSQDKALTHYLVQPTKINMSKVSPVLIVDDSRVIRSITRKTLLDMGFEVHEAADAIGALEHLKGLIPTVMLIDWNMPGLSGLELATNVRQNPMWDKIQLIMLTSEDDIERVKQALAAGVNEYLLKPFTRDSLQAKLSVLGIRIPQPYTRF